MFYCIVLQLPFTKRMQETEIDLNYDTQNNVLPSPLFSHKNKNKARLWHFVQKYCMIDAIIRFWVNKWIPEPYLLWLLW